MVSFKGNMLPAILTILICCISSLSQTQAEMNQDACSEYKRAVAALNKVYRQILNEYKSDRVFVAKLKVAQRAWLAFRDAHVESLYPATDTREYGTVFTMCWCMALTEITKKRSEEISKWATGIEEGDVCSGSIKIRD